MSAAYVQVAVDSTGKKVQTFENTVGSDVVESQGVVLVDTAGTAITTLPVSIATVPSHAVTNAGTFAVQIADGSNAVEGATTGAAVTTDANGTIQQYLRGLVKLIAAKITVGIDQTTPGTTNAVCTAQRPGGANMANGQVTASGSAATLITSRALRRYVTIKNTDTALAAHIGIASVTTGNGMPLLAGESITLETQALVQVIAASGAPVLAYVEVYD